MAALVEPRADELDLEWVCALGAHAGAATPGWSDDTSAARHASPSGGSPETHGAAWAPPPCFSLAGGAALDDLDEDALLDFDPDEVLEGIPDACDVACAAHSSPVHSGSTAPVAAPQPAGSAPAAPVAAPGPAAAAEEEERRLARLARNREAAAMSRARRRAAADGADARCRQLTAANAELQSVVARLMAENHALRAHILAHCPPAAPPSDASARAAAAPAVTPAPGVVAPPPLVVLPPVALPLPLPLLAPPQGNKVPLPRVLEAARPKPAARKVSAAAPEPATGGKRVKRTMLTAAATLLMALSMIASPYQPQSATPALPAAVTHPLASFPLNATAVLVAEAPQVSSTAPAAAVLPPPLISSALLSHELAPESAALVPVFDDVLARADDDVLSPHARWLAEVWRPLLSLPLSDARAIASLKALSIYASGGGGRSLAAALGDGSGTTAWSSASARSSESWWPAPAVPPLACQKLFEFSALDATVAAAHVDTRAAHAAAAPAAAAAPPPRAVRRLGGVWPLPPSAREAASKEAASASTTRIPTSGSTSALLDDSDEFIVSLLDTPPGVAFGGASASAAGVGDAGMGFTQGTSNGATRAVLVVVMMQRAARYLTYACSL